jgi:glucosamine-6-phosphate deaminase
MEILIVKDYSAISALAANLVARQIKAKPNSVLGLPTGHTPEGMYAKLVEFFHANQLSFNDVSTFNIDAYVGLPRDHTDSYYTYMKQRLFDQVNIRAENIYFLDGDSDNLMDECANYERNIDDLNGLDLLIAGIGHNGHIGFNEPGSSFTGRTTVVDLKDNTRDVNQEILIELKEVPKQALTMGIGTMMKARSIILLASGASKAEIMKQALYGEVTEAVPASVLQTHHDLTVIMDEAAAGIA